MRTHNNNILYLYKNLPQRIPNKTSSQVLTLVMDSQLLVGLVRQWECGLCWSRECMGTIDTQNPEH